MFYFWSRCLTVPDMKKKKLSLSRLRKSFYFHYTLLQVDSEIARRFPCNETPNSASDCLLYMRRIVSSSCEPINRIMVARREHGAKAHPLTYCAPPSSSTCFLCMEPLSVATTESAIINTAVHKTELSVRRGSRFFFLFKRHTPRYTHEHTYKHWQVCM